MASGAILFGEFGTLLGVALLGQGRSGDGREGKGDEQSLHGMRSFGCWRECE